MSEPGTLSFPKAGRVHVGSWQGCRLSGPQASSMRRAVPLLSLRALLTLIPVMCDAQASVSTGSPLGHYLITIPAGFSFQAPYDAAW